MRRLAILLVAAFVAMVIAASGVDAARTYSKRSRVRCKTVKTYRVVTKKKCYRVRHKKWAKAMPARRGAGPVVKCPAPVVHVPAQAAPIVNVPQQPAPVVNIPALPPMTSISEDSDSIYILHGDRLLILDKNSLCLKKQINIGTYLQQPISP